MPPLVDSASKLVTLLLLVAVGLDLTLDDFRRVRDRPGVVTAGVLLPPLLLPPLAIALIELVAPSPVIAAGLLLLTVCPIGGISNTYSMLARASTALSVTLTAVSCAAALVTIPAATALLERVWGHSSCYAAPIMALVMQLLVVLVPPVVGGMLIRARWPALATRHRPVVQGIAFALLAALLMLVIASGAGGAEIGWWSAVQLALAFVASAFLLGAVVGGVAALLLAPEKGEVTRRRLREGGGRIVRGGRDAVNHAVTAVEETAREKGHAARGPHGVPSQNLACNGSEHKALERRSRHY